jgi:hypothetical protein
MKTAAEVQSKRYRSLQLSLEWCEAVIESARKSLHVGNATAARCAFQQAEAIFEEAQQYLQHVARDDWREEIERTLTPLGSKLDHLWVKMMSSGCPSQVLSGRHS